MEIVHDDIPANENNPNGFFETRKIAEFTPEFADSVEGKVVKVVSPLLWHLLDGRDYKVLLMNRKKEEVIASRRKMLKENEPSGWHLYTYKQAKQREEDVIWKLPHLVVDYNKLMADKKVDNIIDFLGLPLDKDKMVEVIDPNLYRNRL